MVFRKKRYDWVCLRNMPKHTNEFLKIKSKTFIILKREHKNVSKQISLNNYIISYRFDIMSPKSKKK